MNHDGERARVERLLGGVDLTWLLQKIRERLEKGQDLVGVVQLRNASRYQRQAVADLFSRPLRPGSSAMVRLEDLDLVLRRTGAWPNGLASAVVAVTGPITKSPTAATTVVAAVEEAWAPVAAAVEQHPHPDLRDALAVWWRNERAVRARITTATPAQAEQTARDLAAVLELLPAAGIGLEALAQAATGRADALHSGHLVQLALRAAAAMSRQPAVSRPSTDEVRSLWAAVGVVRDETSSSVVCLGLPSLPSGATGRALAAWSAVTQPVVLTLRHLRLDPPQWRTPGRHSGNLSVVWVVQEPEALAAIADRSLELGTSPPPVVCVGRWPSAAAVQVLQGLSAAGWTLRYHGALDLDGIALGEWLVTNAAVHPWGMGEHHFRKALAAGHGRPASFPADLNVSWDSALGPAMHQSQRFVEHSGLLGDLLGAAVEANSPGSLT